MLILIDFPFLPQVPQGTGIPIPRHPNRKMSCLSRLALLALLLGEAAALRVPATVGKTKCDGCSGRCAKGAAMATSTRPPEVVVVTHAAGRMGTLASALIREEHDANDEPVIVRALVRSDSEATKLRCELLGMRILNGTALPARGDPPWLQPLVVGDDDEEALRSAFDGATAALFCSAAHTGVAVDASGEHTVSVPAEERARQSSRLLSEIGACAASKTVRAAVLRSTLGVSCLARCAEEAADADAAWAVARMGGAEALAAADVHEATLRASGVPSTIVRLGALTDDAGGIPLAFGADDDLLLQAAGGATPPYLSRADAARVAVRALRDEALRGRTLECAWGWRWGRSSVGSDEARVATARQDLVADALGALVR